MSMSGEPRLARFSTGPSMGTGEVFLFASPSTAGVSVWLCFKSTCSCKGNASLSDPVSKFACDWSVVFLCVKVVVDELLGTLDSLSSMVPN